MISALVLVAASQPDQLAFVSRFYKPGAAVSRLEIYLSALDGTKRRMLPLQEVPLQVRWLERDRLAVQTQLGVYVGSVKSWKPKLIDSTTYYEITSATDRITAPGIVQLSKYEDGDNAVLDPKTLNLDKIDFSKLPEPIDAVDSTYSTTEPNGGKLSFEVGKPMSLPGMNPNEKREFLFRRGWFSGTGPKRLFLQATANINETNGDLKSMIVLEANKKPRVLWGHVIDFDFWDQRPSYAYCSREKESLLDPKNKKSSVVTTNELHIGDWIKGTDRKLFSGAVRTVSVAIRP
jgi:hypothetical protein